MYSKCIHLKYVPIQTKTICIFNKKVEFELCSHSIKKWQSRAQNESIVGNKSPFLTKTYKKTNVKYLFNKI